VDLSFDDIFGQSAVERVKYHMPTFSWQDLTSLLAIASYLKQFLLFPALHQVSI
jgi:hypothetical protein